MNKTKNIIKWIKNYIPILMYHRVNDYYKYIPEISIPSISPKLFESHIKYLVENNYKFCTFSEYLSDTETQDNIKKRVCITFDDGFRDNYIFAFPILKKYKVRATFFVVSKYLNTTELFPTWKDLPYPEKHYFMTNDQVKELIDNGMEIGGHSFSHKNLHDLTEDEIRKEITDEMNHFKKNFNINIKTLSYPRGHYNNKVIKVLKELNFIGACTVTLNNFDFINEDINYRIERETMRQESIFMFKLKVYGIHRILRRIKKIGGLK